MKHLILLKKKFGGMIKKNHQIHLISHKILGSGAVKKNLIEDIKPITQKEVLNKVIKPLKFRK